MRRFFVRLWNVLRPSHGDLELTRELGAHLALLQDEYERRGMSPEEAYRAARMSFGGIEQTKELHRDARSFIWLNDARQDGVHAVRLLRRSPMFTLTAALSLAIGIGANTAIFSVANGLLFRAPDGIAEPRTLVDIGTLRGDGGLNPMPYSSYLEIGRRATTLSGVFAQHMFPRVMSLSASTTATAERVFGHYVTTEFFSVLSARASAGRVFDGRDGDARNASPVAVLSHGFWARRFSQDPDVIGHVIRINDRPFTVIGVASPGFQGTGLMSPDVWLPLSAEGGQASVLAGGRVRAGVSAAQAAAELASIGASLDREQGTARRGQPLYAIPSTRAGGNRNVVIGFAGVLMIIISLVLAVACANVAAIMLARSTARSKEMALRTALGARRGRLVRRLLTETVMLLVLAARWGLRSRGQCSCWSHCCPCFHSR
jgi:ABC-type antimicrobial peptide transport system permease subunit